MCFRCGQVGHKKDNCTQFIGADAVKQTVSQTEEASKSVNILETQTAVNNLSNIHGGSNANINPNHNLQVTKSHNHVINDTDSIHGEWLIAKRNYRKMKLNVAKKEGVIMGKNNKGVAENNSNNGKKSGSISVDIGSRFGVLSVRDNGELVIGAEGDATKNSNVDGAANNNDEVNKSRVGPTKVNGNHVRVVHVPELNKSIVLSMSSQKLTYASSSKEPVKQAHVRNMVGRVLRKNKTQVNKELAKQIAKNVLVGVKKRDAMYEESLNLLKMSQFTNPNIQLPSFMVKSHVDKEAIEFVNSQRQLEVASKVHNSVQESVMDYSGVAAMEEERTQETPSIGMSTQPKCAQ
ncbi:hypothetical protein GYH30_010355 [Glycine max]|nr:hypothetical protein GYH30_010355 [Glycine max]